MEKHQGLPLRDLDEDAALRTILEGTATETGERFFAALVERLAEALGTQGAWVTEYIEETRRLRTLAAWMGGRFLNDHEYEIAGTPCEQVIDEARLVHFRENVAELFPDDPELKEIGAVSYMGVPLIDLDGRILGNTWRFLIGGPCLRNHAVWRYSESLPLVPQLNCNGFAPSLR